MATLKILNFDSDIEIKISASRNKISAKPTVDSTTVTFSSSSKIDKWECRATKIDDEFGEGIGILINNGGAVLIDADTQFTIPYSALTLGDGEYRISVYIQSNKLGEPKISFDYNGAQILPFINIDGVNYVYLAELEEREFITATDKIYLYDSIDITPITCGIFTGYYQANKQYILLGKMGVKISGYIRRCEDNG